MRATLLIDKQDVFKFTNLSGNVDPDKLNPYIKAAQDQQIQDALGTKLYTKLLDDVDANTLTGDYLTLVTDYIQPALIWYALADLYLFQAYEITNAGVLRKTPEDYQLADSSEISRLQKSARLKADNYNEALIRHLCYYPQNYPEYNQGQQDGQYPNADPNNYITGINL